MKTIRILLSVLMVFVVVAHCGAQVVRVSCFYDDCGNRIQRSIIGFKKSDDKSTQDISENESWLSEVNDSIAGTCFSLFPNPTDDRFSLVLVGQENSSVHVTLCTIEGSIIEERDITQHEEEFYLSGQAAGIYLLRLRTNNETQTWKIIKKQ